MEALIAARIRAVPAPRPVLSRAEAAALTTRQQELLDQLTELMAGGFSHLTMADLAARLNCSLRTLYGLAESRDRLILVALDRNLWRIGRAATEAVVKAPADDPVEAVRIYLSAANLAVEQTTPSFARDLRSVEGGPELGAAHSDYLVAVTAELLALAAEQRFIRPINTRAVAAAAAGLGRLFAEPDVIDTLGASPKEAADEVVEIVLRGLRLAD